MREFGDFLDEAWCGGGVVEDEGEVGFELGDVVDLGDGLGVEVVVNAVAEFLGEFGGGVVGDRVEIYNRSSPCSELATC